MIPAIETFEFTMRARWYVYAINVDGTRVYVGKGCGGRMLDHAWLALNGGDSRLAAAIRNGAKVTYEILGWFSEASEALTFETKCIVAIGTIEDGGTLLNHYTKGRIRGLPPRTKQLRTAGPSKSEPAPKLLVTAQEAAEAAKVALKTLEAWRSTDKGPPFIRLTGERRGVRYPVDKLKAWIEEQGR